mgnify:CR=1 FL=1|jgi:hypothetical protein
MKNTDKQRFEWRLWAVALGLGLLIGIGLALAYMAHEADPDPGTLFEQTQSPITVCMTDDPPAPCERSEHG